MRTIFHIAVTAVLLAVLPNASLASSKKPFTATAVQTVNGQQDQPATLYVSDNGSRYEYVERGREIVKITLNQKKIMRILFPQEKLYMEIQAPADLPTPMNDASSPCPPVDGLTCEKIADAKFGDIDVEQWTQHHAPSNSTSTMWWEPVRKMIVRQEFPDGRIMQLKLAGDVDHEGRATERWDISFATPDGKVMNSYRLVDRDLGIIVKEENPQAGLARELRGLKVVDSDSGWFDVPAGYQRIDAPQRPAQ